MKRDSALFLTQFGILLALEALFCFTPLGSLPAFGPIVATLAMVPVVITAILLGPGAGSLMGAFAGLFSLMVWTFMPPTRWWPLFSPLLSDGRVFGQYRQPNYLLCAKNFNRHSGRAEP